MLLKGFDPVMAMPAVEKCIVRHIYFSTAKGLTNFFSARRQHLSWRESCITIEAHPCD